MLSCLHSFCQECLHREVERFSAPQETGVQKPQQNSGIKCPTCAKMVSIPAGGVDDLPQDLHLDFETKCSQYQSRISQRSGVACDVCIDSSFGPALGFCCTCIQFLCKMCCDYHKHARHLHHHKIITLGKKVAMKELLAAIKPSEPSCSLHDQNKLRFYCETCNCSICRDCTVVAHKDHKCGELSTTAQSCRKEINSLLASAQEIGPKLTRAIDGNIKVLEETEESEKTIAQTIKDTFLQLHKALDDRMNQLLGDVHSITLSRTTALGLQRESFEGLKQNVSQYFEFSSHITQAYTDHELMALKQLPSMELQAAIKQAESVSLLPCRSGELKLILKTDILISEFSKLAYVIDFPPCPAKSKWIRKSHAIKNTPYQLKVEAFDSSGQKYLHGELHVSAKIQYEQIQQKKIQHKRIQASTCPQVIEGKIEDHSDGTYTITLTPLTAGPHKLLITIDGQNIKNIPYDLEVRDAKPNYSTINGPHQLNTSITSPLCIAIHENGDLFIGSEANCIYVLDQNGVQKSVIGSKGNGPGQFNTPSGLAIKDDALYVADRNNHRVQKLTISGDFIAMFGKFGSAQGEFNCPCALVVDTNDRLIVADSGNCRIQVMNLDGTYLSSICGNKFLFQSIDGLAGLDPEGNILVIDSSRVVAISLNGTITKECACSQYGKPLAGATDYQGYTLILAEASCALVVNDPSGNVYCTSQLYGGSPKGIALNPNDGNVFIVAGTQNVGGVVATVYYQNPQVVVSGVLKYYV